MSDDLLKRATAALRETSAEPEPRSGLTRTRLLESAHRRRDGMRGAVVRWLVGLGAVLVAGTALARVAPQLPELLRAMLPGTAEQQAPAPAPARTPRPRRAAPARVERPVPPPPPPPAPVPAPTPPPASAPTPVLQRRLPAATQPVAAPRPAPAPQPAPEPAELALFRRAQQLHLARDPAAIDAWEDYLRVAERGVLVPEARYNRALGLVRAGRSREARAALEPFARGDYGDYRRGEARALLDALARDASNP